MLLLCSQFWTLSKFYNVTVIKVLVMLNCCDRGSKKGKTVDWFDSEANWGRIIFYLSPVYVRQTDH